MRVKKKNKKQMRSRTSSWPLVINNRSFIYSLALAVSHEGHFRELWKLVDLILVTIWW